MLELTNKIARLEMLSEQLGIHLQLLPRHSREAAQTRSRLYRMMEKLAELKSRKQRLKAELELREAA